MPEPRMISLPDFLTEEQIHAAYKIYLNNDFPAAEIDKRIITPNMEEINRKLGQENASRYLAYCCEFVFNRLDPKKIGAVYK